jgi:phosphoglycolate phosphatase-like HAD superfamily hydrolase
VESAKRAGVPAIGLLAGGFGHDELVTAGAVVVVDDVRELLDRADEWLPASG